MSTYRLKQLPGGNWTVKLPELPTLVISEPTPDAAVKTAEAARAEFELFLRHVYRECDPATCGRCKDGVPQYPAGVRRKGKRHG